MVLLLVMAQALAFDHSHAGFAEVLNGAVSPAGVKYSILETRSQDLDAYLREVASADATAFTQGEKLALYVNAYNAYTLRTVLDAGSISSIMELDEGKVWDARSFQVAGQPITLNQMEKVHVQALTDGRGHTVLNCAAKGCPPLRATPLRAADIETQLDAAARSWAQTGAYRLEGKTLTLSMLFEWYAADFAAGASSDAQVGKAEAAVRFLVRFVDSEEALALRTGDYTVTWMPYDWALNGVD